MAASDISRSRPTYGNWRTPRSSGLGALGLLATVIVFTGLVLMIVMMMTVGLVAAGVVAVVCVVLIGVLTVRDRHSKTLGQRILARVAWWRTRRVGAHLYRSGPLGRTPWGTYQLPGLAAASELSEYQDSYGRPFALLRVPATGHYTVVLSTEPDGAALVDPEQVDLWVAHWGAWLAALGQEPSLTAAAVTVETAPDSGSRLRREVATHTDPAAPPIAQQMLDEVMATYPQGSAVTRAWVTLTFTAAVHAGGRRRDANEMGRELASRLPGLTQGLHATGAGAARPMTAQQLCEVVRVAYDPAVARLLDEAHAAAEHVELTWPDAGPTATQARWDSYAHDSAVSRSWTMTVAPRGEVQSQVLAQLLAPHPDIDRKRVTLLYRPLDPATAARLVEADKRNADLRVSSTHHPSARVLLEKRAADATAAEEARGAGLLNFGAVVTATVTDQARFADAGAAVDNLAATARLQLRPAYGAQDSAFLAGLPLGLVLSQHLKVPSELRAAM